MINVYKVKKEIVMEASKIDMYMSANQDKFPSDKIMLIRDQLEKLDDNKFGYIQSIDIKNPTTLLIVSIFLGGLGVDRFMLGQSGLGVAKLLTCGGLGVWALVDLFLIMGKTKELNYQKIMMNAI